MPFCYMAIEALKICVIFQCLTRQLEDRKASAVFVLCTHSTSHYNRTANGIQSLRGNGFYYITASHTIDNAHRWQCLMVYTVSRLSDPFLIQIGLFKVSIYDGYIETVTNYWVFYEVFIESHSKHLFQNMIWCFVS